MGFGPGSAWERHDDSGGPLPDTATDKPRRSKFKRYPLGYFHIDIAEVRNEEG